MIYYKDNSEIRHGADTRTIPLDFQGRIVVGKFVDKERPTYLDAMNSFYQQKLGENYTPYKG
jgi:2-oxoglutarate ferredoxin oxidoreductase subunit beta